MFFFVYFCKRKPRLTIGDISSITSVTTPVTKSEYVDLQGRRVSPLTSDLSPLKKGIYIENGRKRVVNR